MWRQRDGLPRWRLMYLKHLSFFRAEN